MRENINNFIQHIIKITNEENIINHLKILIKLYNYTSEKISSNNIGKEVINIDYINNIDKSIKTIQEKNIYINTYMKNLSKTLDDSVYGHKRAKKQIERIIGQWINGENTGYCFGFEGPAGVGKTSLAKKGISKCLIDVNGESRPFSFIAIGGTSNGSSLEGHNYTYLGSTWGRIVDILIETKCMNPIIFIDELDKVSNTEHGKEIIRLVEEGALKELVVEEFSRLGRNAGDVIQVLEWLDEHEVNVVVRNIGLQSRPQGERNPIWKMISSVMR
jgi:ATP-dependent Lon protease